MNDNLRSELGCFYLIDHQKEDAKSRIEKAMTKAIKEVYPYFGFICQVMPSLVHLVGDEKPSNLGVKVVLEEDRIDFGDLSLIKEACGAKNIYVRPIIDDEVSGQDVTLRIELEIVLPYIPYE